MTFSVVKLLAITALWILRCYTQKSFCFYQIMCNMTHLLSENFSQKLTEYIKNNFAYIRFIAYFSDVCAGQHISFKNILNLTHHQLDFNHATSWSFFATSHG